MTRYIAIALCVAVLGLSGCSQPTKPVPITEVVTIVPELPSGLEKPCPMPQVPPPGSTQRDVAAYTLDLVEANENCEARRAALVGVWLSYKSAFDEKAEGAR